MQQLKKLIRALSLIIQQPSLLNLVLDDAEVNRQAVIKKYGFENGLPAVDIRNFLTNNIYAVSPYSFTDGGSTITDLALLKALAEKYHACEYFEIGTWMGESVANVALVAAHCTTLNLPDDEMRHRGLPEKYIQLHRFFSKQLNNVTHLQANSLNFDYSSLNKKFDLIFIDGDHHYESVKSDTQNAFKLLKDEHSMIVWHDYGNTPADIRWDVFRGILDGMPTAAHQYLYRVSNTICAVYCKQPINSYQQLPHGNPDKNFEITIKTRPV